jgi:DNA-directed RNA polymerase specialized sigma24 family protein
VPDDTTLIDEIRKTNRLLTILATRDVNQRTAIGLLDSVGFKPKEIAELLNTTSNTVSVELSKVRKLNIKKPAAKKALLNDKQAD